LSERKSSKDKAGQEKLDKATMKVEVDSAE
jgi:hypothetical protein